ncbi:AraC family transcriptional regulator [Bordetella ansorpii]|uniref:AraC family transcriptional regulator n=1 Tax=Bordetella ansorpii TaxID=288768 RepID=A0A157S563_9BORD|nr:DJ-1/PfpI family protein [Bordetella ansorpii]SAI65525.1 AraC family transcriptional regulator [Bordetella ansorpii]
MKIPGFRLGIYVYRDAEILDYAAPYGVLSVARRFAPEIDICAIGETLQAVGTASGLTVLPAFGLADAPAIDALLIPGGPGARQQMHNRRLHRYIASLPSACLLAGSGSGVWVYACMGLLDGLAATSRKEPDRIEASHLGCSPIDRLAMLAPACRTQHARIVDSGRIVSAAGPAVGIDLGLHLLRRAGYPEAMLDEVARVMEYRHAYELHRADIEYAPSGLPSNLVSH